MVKRNVRDLDSEERRLYEQTIGRKLVEDQQIIIQVINVKTGTQPTDNGTGSQPAGELPDWCNVYDGLSDEEIADVERAALRLANYLPSG